MIISEGEPSSSAAQAIGLIVAVKELQGLKALDLNKLLRDSENLTIQYCTKNGLLLKIDMEKLAGSLPLHLISMLISFKRDEALFRYLLSAIRLLYSLCDLASRISELEQIFLDDVKLFDQLLDFVFYMLIVLGGFKQEDHAFCHRHLVHSTLVPCTFYLLTGFISTKWQDVVHVLLAHPKIDIFMDAAFGSVRMVVRCLEITLLAYYNDFSMESNLTAEQVVYYLCQQCEASLQFLQSLCQQKLFKERLLMNKEICGEGGVLFLALSILKLQIQPSLPTRIKAALSRLKSKILSILLGLCEVESISYLDEVASSPQSLALAKSVASEVLDLLKIAFGRDSAHPNVDGCHPMGFVQLNAMRLADILSDDSNFRSYVMLCFTKVLTAIISLSHGDFLSCWCSSNLPETEEDCNVEYDIFAAVGWVLDYTSLDITNATNLEFIQIPNKMPRASYAHHKTSLLIKLFANLHCFVPNICEEMEENHFVLKVLECLQMDLSDILPGFSFASDAPKAAIASKNLRSLLSHAESLIPNYLNTEDLQLLRVFSSKLQSLFSFSSTGFEGNHIQDGKFELSLSWDNFTKLNTNEHYQVAQNAVGCPSPLTGKEPACFNKRGNSKEGMSKNAAFPDINQPNTRAEDINKGSDINMQDQEDNVISASGTREIDVDAPNTDTSSSDTSSANGKNSFEHMYDGKLSKLNEDRKKVAVKENKEDEKLATVQKRKRKRNIMNDKQVALIESALLDKPDMHRNAASLQSWEGSEVTPSQLKNWLNNRKAKLARAAKDVRAAPAANVDNPILDKPTKLVLGSFDSPDSPGDALDTRDHSLAKIASSENSGPSVAGFASTGSLQFVPCNAGQVVVIVDAAGDEVGKGKVFQMHGKWYEKSLEESSTCVVDVSELKIDKGLRLPYPSVATGNTFAEAELKVGVIRVQWDLNRVFSLWSE
ncbi:LOW QUALITY PROTEIN: nodulin homeobox-like [Arachis duranensis]|uniref:LOW QUALITY PROTEIN: nodulin homeobox-like n=1 Tax=Arachis duranensis TaxID=130453 RepID=A0A6P4BCM5_ARADU|nr:LOW QUALITY PROTEIN: nodulin homeobox-like [Arachis duranensis]